MARRDTLAPHTEEAHAVLQDFAQRLLDAKANAPSHLLIGSLSVHVLMPDGSRVLLRLVLEEDWPAAQSWPHD